MSSMRSRTAPPRDRADSHATRYVRALPTCCAPVEVAPMPRGVPVVRICAEEEISQTEGERSQAELAPMPRAAAPGLRIEVGTLGPVPLALDFAVPLNRGTHDHKQLVDVAIGV